MTQKAKSKEQIIADQKQREAVRQQRKADRKTKSNIRDFQRQAEKEARLNEIQRQKDLQ